MSLQKDLYDYETNSNFLDTFCLELAFVAIAVGVKSESFLAGVITYIVLMVSLASTIIASILAILFTIFWTVLSVLISCAFFEWPTITGIGIFTFLSVGGLHVGAVEFNHEVK